ncbi:MAG: WG repeat-containing protein [Candidatus Obscuribacterales bacterium]
MRIPNSLLASSLVVLAALAPLSCARANPELEGKAASAGDLAGPRWKVIDKTGREIFSVPTNVRLGDYSENLAMFACWDGEQSEFGYLAPDGAIAIPAGFGSGTNFHKGRAFVHLRPRTASGSLSVGIINRRGKILKRVDSHYLSLYGATNDGFFQIERLPGGRGSHGLVDNRGRILIPCKYDWVDSPREQLVVVRDGNEYGYLDLSGQEVVAPSYTLGAGFSEGLARVAIERQRNDGVVHISCLPIDPRYGFIDKRGKLVLPTSYKSAGSFSEGLSAVEDSGGCKYIDKTGADAFGTTFEAARSFSSGLAAVRKNGLWGFIDRSGRLVIPYRYILAGPFEGDSAVFAIHGSGRKSSLCDIQHNKLEFDERIREPSFLKALTLDDCFRPRLKFGVVDRTGSEIVEPIYDNILPLSDGMRLVEKEDRYGFIDRSGKEVIPPAFRFATDFNCGRAQVTEEPIPYRDKLSFGQASDPIIPVTPRQDCVPPTVDPDTTESNIQTCSRVIALEPESATAYANRGWFAFALGR